MKILFSSMIFAASLSFISCASPVVNNNSNLDLAVTSPPSSPPVSPTPLIEEPAQTEAIPSDDSTSFEEPSTSQKVAQEIAKQLPERDPVVILPTRDGNLDASEESEEMAEEVAEQLRKSGYTVQTRRAMNVASAINKIFGRSKGIRGPSIGRLGTALGLGAIILVGLANADENEKSVTTSIYTNNRGVFEEISNSSLKTKDKSAAFQQRTSPCTENLLTNGDFEKDWEKGWNRTYSDIDEGSSVTEVIGASGSNLLHMQHKGLASVSLHQTASVPKGRIFFQFESKFVAREGPIGGFSGTGTAGFTIIFFDANKKYLGLLWVGSHKKNIFEDTGLVGVPQSPQSTNSAAFIALDNDRKVNDRLEISRIARDRLGKLDLSKIKYVAVSISVGATHQSASAEAWVDNLSLEVCQ
ncbi:MAG TPA: hypothetical protein VGO50_02475 [Pyrinomonadaceae bacterium]|jgi:hypothetical protein|nr:hypothetical protein [Pyrinomonadaceae bacterium]